MTSSAPAARASLALASVDTVPITRAPRIFAIWQRRSPTPPAAPPQPRRGDGGELGIGAQPPRIGHPVAHLHLAHVGAHLGDDAPALHAERDGELGLVEAGAVVHIDEVEPRRFELHHRLAGARLRIGNILQREHFRPAEGLDADRFPAASSPCFPLPGRERVRVRVPSGPVSGGNYTWRTPPARMGGTPGSPARASRRSSSLLRRGPCRSTGSAPRSSRTPTARRRCAGSPRARPGGGGR